MITPITYTPAEVQAMGSDALRIAVAMRKGWQWYESPSRRLAGLWPPESDPKWERVNFSTAGFRLTGKPPLPEYRFSDWDRLGIDRETPEYGLPNWSEDLTQAMDLLAEGIAEGLRPVMAYRRDCILPTGETHLGWWVTINGTRPRAWVLYGETLPLAICRAWLLATNPAPMRSR